MKNLKELSPDAEVVQAQAVDVELNEEQLNEEQLDALAGGQSVFQDWVEKAANIFKPRS